LPYIYNMYKIAIIVLIVNLILNITYAVDSVVCHIIISRYGLLCIKSKSHILQKSLKIPKGQSETIYRRRIDNTMAKRKSTKGQTTIDKAYI
jgi:hypothetical protein